MSVSDLTYLFTRVAEIVTVILDMILNMRLYTVHSGEELATEEADMLDPAGGVQGHVSLLKFCLHWPVRDVYVHLKNRYILKVFYSLEKTKKF